MLISTKYQEVGKRWSVGKILVCESDGCVGHDGTLYIKGPNGLFNTRTCHFITDLNFQIDLHHLCNILVTEL